jgi:hypothetical protein
VRSKAIVLSVVALSGLALGGLSDAGVSAQDAAGERSAHPLVGTWMVDTNVDIDTDLPEVGIFTSDGSVFGLGATRWVSGSWEAADDHTGNATMAGVFDANGGGYVVVRGPHQVDDTGDAWTCPCTFTVVAPDGTVLDSGSATARGTRLPVESVEAVGQPLAGFPTWAPAVMAESTPTE